jgi:transmembrane sensor
MGQAPEKTNHVIDQWYDAFDANRPQELPPDQEQALRDAMWQKIRPELHTRRIIYLKPALRIAAASTLLLTGGLLYLLLRQSPYTTLATANGQKSTFTLEDGTQLVLNAGSTVHVSHHGRQVDILDGEVLFNVKHGAARPFTVHSGPLTTTVLGTSFDVYAYKGINRLSVGVLSGKVSVSNPQGEPHVLTQHQELAFDQQNGRSTLGEMDEDQPAWQQNTLEFNDASFQEMSVLMQKNFGVQIVANQTAIQATRYTTSLSTTMSAIQATQVLAAIHHLKIKVTGTTVLLYE